MQEGKGGKGGKRRGGASRGTDLLTISGYVSSCRPSPNPSREALCTCSADRSWEFGEQETKAPPSHHHLPFFPTPHPFPFPWAPSCHPPPPPPQHPPPHPQTHTHTHTHTPHHSPPAMPSLRHHPCTISLIPPPWIIMCAHTLAGKGDACFQYQKMEERPSSYWLNEMAMGVFKPQSIIHDSSSERIRVHYVDTAAIHVRTLPTGRMIFLAKSC